MAIRSTRDDAPPVVAQDTGARPQLKRSLGLTMATALVVGNMVGSGVFSLPASLAGTGPISLLSWVITGTGAILLALVFANLGRAYPQTGGPYAFTRRAFGDFAGFWTAWGYWIAAWAGNAAIAVVFVSYATVFWPSLGTNNALAFALGLGIIWLLTAVNVAGARQSGVVQVVTTVLKFVPLVLIGLIGIFSIDTANFTPFDPNHASLAGHWHAISFAATLTLWAFIGLESATIPAEEVRDPERTLPRATMLGTIATTAMYVLATVAIMGVIPSAQLADSNAPFADAATKIFGSSLLGVSPAKVVAAVAMISAFGALNGWILIQGRVPLAAAEDGLFPRQFAKVSGTRRTPVVGLVASSVLLSVLLGMNYQSSLAATFTKIIILATITTLVPYAFSAAAQVLLMLREPERFAGRRVAVDATVAIVAFAYSFWMIYGAGQEYIAQGFLLLLAGIPVYVYMKWSQGRREPVPVLAEVPDAASIPATPATPVTANGLPVRPLTGAKP
jgi:APA family basic amino acid/polyamine antiporter